MLLSLAREDLEGSARGTDFLLLLLGPLPAIGDLGPLPAFGDDALGALLLSLPVLEDTTLGALLLSLPDPLGVALGLGRTCWNKNLYFSAIKKFHQGSGGG